MRIGGEVGVEGSEERNATNIFGRLGKDVNNHKSTAWNAVRRTKITV